MSDEPTFCPACNQKYKFGVLGTNQPLSPPKIAAINDALGENRTAACNKCGEDAYSEARSKLLREQAQLRPVLNSTVSVIPILSLQAPVGWTYMAIGMVTAQSTTGTGIIADIASAWTDAFGLQSGVFNNKIRAGEDLCKASLRQQAIGLGGNAILAADIDYAEVGGQRAMLMVCMTGTAVRVTNQDAFDPSNIETFTRAETTYKRLTTLADLLALDE